MNEIRHRTIDFFIALFIAFLLIQGVQWILGYADWHFAYPWNKIAFVIITILVWSPWRKLNLPKHNADNNDLFPGA
jgi:hypothetical protein